MRRRIVPNPLTNLIHHVDQMRWQRAGIADGQILLELRQGARANDDSVTARRVEVRVVQHPA
jgi:hypothetical protein